MHPSDNVAVALTDLVAGVIVEVERLSGETRQLEQVATRATVPFGHKVALRPVPRGQPVLKYGEVIGLASTAIAPGDHVHVHNVDSQRGRGDLVVNHHK
jgi:altronate dehydratase small subunit